jgi:hypothetical protein
MRGFEGGIRGGAGGDVGVVNLLVVGVFQRGRGQQVWIIRLRLLGLGGDRATLGGPKLDLEQRTLEREKQVQEEGRRSQMREMVGGEWLEG